MGLQGRLAFVSGGSRGIGRAIAVGLAADGADVAISYRRDEQAAADTVAENEALGRRARAYAGDVSSHDDNRVVAEATLISAAGRWPTCSCRPCGNGPGATSCW